MFSHISYEPFGECAIRLVFDHTINEKTLYNIQACQKIIEQYPFKGLIEIVPSYTSLCIYYDVVKVASLLPPSQQSVEDFIISYVKNLLLQQYAEDVIIKRTIEIPVFYGDHYGPDLAYVAQYHRLTKEEIIHRHTKARYIVHMLGFAPGFAFLGGLDSSIATPRKEVPRLSIDAGAVGIAGYQTGVYPLSTPGGWQIIGRTPKNLFLPNQTPPSLLQAGDIVHFVDVSSQKWEDFL